MMKKTMLYLIIRKVNSEILIYISNNEPIYFTLLVQKKLYKIKLFCLRYVEFKKIRMYIICPVVYSEPDSSRFDIIFMWSPPLDTQYLVN